jgi:predicted enzyme related to lactoylglutathione lyase
MITGIAFTAYPSANVAKLREWYQNVLGVTFGKPYMEDGNEEYNEARIGDGYFSLMNSGWLQATPGSGVGITFEVSDIDETIATLRERGVKIEDPYVTPVCKVASLHDPEGNKVTLHQITVPH